MQQFRADLHIHTLLSPCGDVEMTPRNIVHNAKARRLDIIGITDHNSTRNALLVKKLAQKEGIFVLTGAEITTREEVHCLAFFETEEQLSQFQQYIDENITKIPNDEEYFGYQPVIDEDENIVEMIPYYLPAALKQGITKVQQKIESLNGLFIPAHIDRSVNGILSQLGFIPPGLKCDALGLSKHGSKKDVEQQYVLQNKITLIRNSDAHYVEQIGEIYSLFNMKEISFSEIKMALNQQNKRFVEIR
ncbi:MAG TPA: PHP domain-containing protein [Tangfeifania sp.]|nr:PHP domain-containing protein [Tangfeifania sp.]